MYCLEVRVQSSEVERASAVHMFLASLPHGLREVWIESIAFSPDRYTDLVLGYRGEQDFNERGWSTYWPSNLTNRLHCLMNRQTGRRTTKDDSSSRLAGTAVKFLFSVVELLIALRNINEHHKTIVPDLGAFVRSNFPFLLSHVWHVRSSANISLRLNS